MFTAAPFKSIFTFAVPVIAVACAVSDASAQIVPFSDRPAWTNAASPTGQVDCDDLESSPTGSFPIPYHTGGNWLLESQGVPSAADVVAPGSINGSHQVQIRSAGPEGIHLTPPCQPCAAFGFDYQTRGAPWVVTVNGQPFNLPPGTTGFFGVTSTVPITSITLGTAQPGVLMALDNLCCAEGGVVGDPCLRDSIQLNTGVDHNTNTAYPIGVHDAWYQVVADPDSTTFEPRPAGTILKHPAWADPEPNTQWLGGYPTNQAILNGYYVYETCFCLQEGYQNVSITLGARADDEVQVFFNEPTPSQPNTFTNLVHTGDPYSAPTLTLVNINNSPLLHPGRNCLQFRVQNTGSVASGLNALVTVNAPGSFVLDPTCCSNGSTITGLKWNDLDGDGIHQANEPVLPNWTINLNPGGSVQTDSNGFYYFNNLNAGNYTVSETQQGGWSQTYPANDHVLGLGANVVVPNLDFGNQESPAAICEAVPGQCCYGRPHFNSPAYNGFGSLVTVGTASPSAVGTAVVAVFDVSNPNAGPFNIDFAAPIFTQPSWSETNLGSVFGVTLDATGNIYVTGTTCYHVDSVGTLGASMGAVYKIDGSTGVASVFKLLPNGSATGLGNICYDCDHDQFFVSNMEDGIIYRLDPTGAILSTFDFGTPDNPTNSYPPLGDRVWAVQAHNGRLYFSLWWEDGGNASATVANQIWSVALDGTGNFTGAPQLEFDLPVWTSNFSHPVADIRFSPTGSMLVAERGMDGPTSPVPHQSRLLEFVCEDGQWAASSNLYSVGIGSGTNTAGGVDMDYSVGGRVYATSDAMQLGPQTLYGTQGLPATGGSVANSVLIDFNGNLTAQDKTSIGDVAVPCPVLVPPCMDISHEKVACPLDSTGGGNGCYTYTFTITNHSGFSVKYVSIPLHPFPGSPITINPNIINLLTQDGSLLDDGESTTISLTICGGNPGDTFCIKIGLVTATFEECCFKKVCIELPTCDCGQLREQEITEVTCPEPGVVSFTYNFTLDNLSPFAADWAILIPFKDETASFAKDFFFLPPLQPNGSFPMSVQIVGAQPGEMFCFNVLMQHPGKGVADCCCAFEKCIIVPACQPGGPVSDCAADINGDHKVDVADMLAVINNWGSAIAPCPPSSLADITHDCDINVSDLLAVINGWGPCP